MSKANRYLNQDPTGPKGVLANWQHATDVFVENNYRLSPRYKFLFHAYFDIDSSVPTVANIIGTKANEDISLLVKTSSLPSYTFDTVTKNAYNRKKIIYKQMNYEPLSLTFHDDSAGIMNALWAAYYSYYNNDSELDSHTHWKADNSWSENRHGMDVDTPTRFFKKISLFTMSRQKWLGYYLYGVRIKSWKHGDLDYSEGNGIVENSMTIEFEGVSYDSGSVSEGDPQGFATVRYDKVPSPNTTGGGIGVGGGFDEIMGDFPETDLLADKGVFSNEVVGQLDSYRNIGLPGGVLSQGISGGVSLSNQIGGVLGANFPSNTPAFSGTQATARKLNPLEGFLQDPKAPAYTGDDPIVRARLGLPPLDDGDI